MFDYLEQLRQRPKEYRRKFAVIVSGAFTLVAVGLWVATIPITYAPVHDAVSGPSPLAGIKNVAVSALGSIKKSFGDFRVIQTATTTATTTASGE